MSIYLIFKYSFHCLIIIYLITAQYLFNDINNYINSLSVSKLLITIYVYYVYDEQHNALCWSSNARLRMIKSADKYFFFLGFSL